MKTLLFIASFFLAHTLSAQEQLELYPVNSNGLWGYINDNGKIIIKPQFYNVGFFNEGLAPARANGSFGFINSKGSFVIPPQFDIANEFLNGIAHVYINGRPYYIDKTGKKLFEHAYKKIFSFDHRSYTLVQTNSDKYGIIDKKGALIIDTAFKSIGNFKNGVAIVKGLNHDPYPDEGRSAVYEVGMIDTLGRWVLQYGKYKDIDNFINGFAIVELLIDRPEGERYYDHRGFINLQGQYKFTIPSQKWEPGWSQVSGFYNSLAVIDIYSVVPDTVKEWSSSKHYEYKGAVDTSGKIVFSNPNWFNLSNFCMNRAFAEDKDHHWFLVNTKGEIVIADTFEHISLEDIGSGTCFFEDGIALVKTKKGWTAIDTNGRQITEALASEYLQDYRTERNNNIVHLAEDISTESERYEYKYGFWDLSEGKVIDPKFHFINYGGFSRKLISAMEDERYGYIGHDGKWVWRQKRTTKKGRTLNIDFMNRGYFYASSKKLDHLSGYGGYGGSGNNSKKMSSYTTAGKNLQVLIDTGSITNWSRQLYKGRKLSVINNGIDTLFFSAQDSRLDMKLQAIDKEGNWRDIEYTPSSWCGNSYHTLFLAANEMWSFTIPIYNGELKTRIRAKLLYKKQAQQENDEVVYSNEIEGTVNPGQFWNKQPYYPSGLMDPYND